MIVVVFAVLLALTVLWAIKHAGFTADVPRRSVGGHSSGDRVVSPERLTQPSPFWQSDDSDIGD